MAPRPDFAPYAPLPHAVLRRTDLSPAAKIIFAALADLPPRSDGRVAISLRRLAAGTGQPVIAVRRGLAELERLALGEPLRRPGRRTAWRLLAAADCATVEQGGPCSRQARCAPPLSRVRATVEQTGRVTALTTAPPTQRARARAREVPALLWEAAWQRLAAAYARAFAGSPPASWRRRLAEELIAGNLAVAEHLEARDVLAGLRRAQAGRRPFGMGWVILALQDRQIAESAARRAKQQAAAKEGPPAAQQAPADGSAASAGPQSREPVLRRARALWEGLDAPARECYLQLARARFPRAPGFLLESQASLLAWQDAQKRMPGTSGRPQPGPVPARLGRQ